MKKVWNGIPGVFLILFCSIVVADEAPQPLIEVKFNDYKNENAVNSGTAGGFFDLINSMRTEGGSGVSGKSDDYALDNSSSGMGKEGGWAEMKYFLNVCEGEVFTISGWFKTNGKENPIRKSARLFYSGNNFEVYGVNSDLRLPLCGYVFTTDFNSYEESGIWVFFAIASDGQRVIFYKGTASQEVQEVDVFEIGSDDKDGKEFVHRKSHIHEANKVVIGNSADGKKSFDGIVDNIRFFGATLSLENLKQIRLRDIASEPIPVLTPEPTPTPTPTPETGGGGDGGEGQKDRLFVVRTEPDNKEQNVDSDSVVIHMNQFVQVDDVNYVDGVDMFGQGGREDEKFFVLKTINGLDIGNRISGRTKAENIESRGVVTFTPEDHLLPGEYIAELKESLRAANNAGTNAENYRWQFSIVSVPLTPTPEVTPTAEATPEPAG